MLQKGARFTSDLKAIQGRRDGFGDILVVGTVQGVRVLLSNKPPMTMPYYSGCSENKHRRKESRQGELSDTSLLLPCLSHTDKATTRNPEDDPGQRPAPGSELKDRPFRAPLFGLPLSLLARCYSVVVYYKLVRPALPPWGLSRLQACRSHRHAAVRLTDRCNRHQTASKPVQAQTSACRTDRSAFWRWRQAALCYPFIVTTPEVDTISARDPCLQCGPTVLSVRCMISSACVLACCMPEYMRRQVCSRSCCAGGTASQADRSAQPSVMFVGCSHWLYTCEQPECSASVYMPSTML